MSDIKTGYDMWDDYKAQYGVITARIMCLRYLDMQANKTDPEEREFCRQLREAMDIEPNMKAIPFYRHSWETAQKNGETELFNDSDKASRFCAGEIAVAIRACEYGNGSYKLKPAVQAFIEYCGTERLSYVLALEVRRNESAFSAENRAWARGFDIQSGFAGRGVRTHPEALDQLVTCLRETMDKTRGDEFAHKTSPEPNETEQSGITEEKPSVMKHICGAQKAPQPRKLKEPGQNKNKGAVEH